MHQHADNQVRKTRSFISYSRTDRVIAERLRDRLIDDGFDAYLDVHDIVRGEPWRERLQALIFGADAVLFLISPDSVSSEICDWEVNEAERLAKRVLPVVCRSTPEEAVPQRLKRLNFTYLDAEDNWQTEYPELCRAIQSDIQWFREHTRLCELAARWDRDQRPDAQLLRIGIVREVRAWELRRPAQAALGDVLLAFIEASEAKEMKDRERLLTITGRAFVRPAKEAFRNGRHDAALRLAAAATLLSEDMTMTLVPEIDTAIPLRRAAFENLAKAVLHGHSDRVELAFFTPDGERVITASKDGTARVWDPSGAQQIICAGHDGGLCSAVISPDGSLLVTADQYSGAPIVWSTATGNKVAVLTGHSSSPEAIAFSGDSARIITAGGHDGSIRVWNARTGEEKMLIDVGVFVKTASFNPDGSRILAASHGGMSIWNAKDGKELSRASEAHAAAINSACFSPDGARIVTASDDRTVKVWSALKAIEPLGSSDHGAEVLSATFSSDGEDVLSASSKGVVTVWRPRTGKAVQFKGYKASFDPSGRRVVTTMGDTTACVWDAVTGEEIVRLRGHDHWIHAARFCPDGRHVVTASHDHTARVWEIASPQILHVGGHQKGITWINFNEDGELLVTASHDKTARVWNASTGTELHCLAGHADSIRAAEFSPDGALIVTASKDKTARIWSAATGAVLHQLVGHARAVNAASFSPDGAQVATASDDGSVRLWSVSTGAEVKRLDQGKADVHAVSFSPDGGRIAWAAGKSVGIWDSATGAEIQFPDHEDDVFAVSFSPDGMHIVSAGGTLFEERDNTARIWNARSARLVAELKGHSQLLYTACFSKDGALVATASADRSARVWDATTGAEIACLRSHGSYVRRAVFHPDGGMLATASDDHHWKVWDVSRAKELAGPAVEVLAASLTSGRGIQSRSEQSDLLMQTAASDLLGALISQLNVSQRDSIARRVSALTRPLHPTCYAPPSMQREPHLAETGGEVRNEEAEQSPPAPPRRERARFSWPWARSDGS